MSEENELEQEQGKKSRDKRKCTIDKEAKYTIDEKIEFYFKDEIVKWISVFIDNAASLIRIRFTTKGRNYTIKFKSKEEEKITDVKKLFCESDVKVKTKIESEVVKFTQNYLRNRT